MNYDDLFGTQLTPQTYGEGAYDAGYDFNQSPLSQMYAKQRTMQYANPTTGLPVDWNLTDDGHARYLDNGTINDMTLSRNPDGSIGYGPVKSYKQIDYNNPSQFFADKDNLIGVATVLTAGLAGAAGGATAVGEGSAAPAWTSGYDLAGGSALPSGADIAGSAGGFYQSPGAGGGTSMEELGSWGDSQTFDQGDWDMDKWTEWAKSSPSTSTSTGSYGLRDLFKDINTGAGTIRNILGTNGAGGSNLAGLLSAYMQSQQQQKMAQQFMDMTAPYRNASTLYGQKLQDTYDHPENYLNSPEYQAIARTNLDLFNRQDAAKGQLSNDIGRQAKMQDLAMSNLDSYRKGLAGIYGQNAQIGTGQGTMMGIGLNGTSNSPYARWLGSL